MNKITPFVEDQLSVYNLVRSNNIVKLQPQRRVSQTPKQDILCKICLQGYVNGEQQSTGEYSMQQNQLIVPCECSGSVGYVHQKCIKLWVQRQLQNTNGKRAFCQICKEEIFFRMMKRMTCSCKNQKSCSSSSCNIVCLVVEMVLLGVMSIFYHYLNSLNLVQIVRYFTVALIFILSITLVLTAYLIFKQNFLKTTKIIQKIYTVRQCQQIGLKQVKYPQNLINAEQLIQRIHVMRKKHKNEGQANRQQSYGTPRRFSSIDPAQQLEI